MAKDYKARPVHDWASHAADAFRYGAATCNPVEIDKRNIDSLRRIIPRGRNHGEKAWMGG